MRMCGKAGAAVVLTASLFCLAGCGESKAAKEARTQGIEQLNSGNYAEAVRLFDTALDEADGVVNRFELDILKYRGEAEYCLGDYAAAAHTYGILCEVDEGKPEYLYYKAASEALAGDLDLALADYDAASQMDAALDRNVTGSGQALTALGAACEAAGEYDRAMEYYQKALDSGESGAEIYNRMGLCLSRAGRYDEAIVSFEKGIALGDEAWAEELQYNEGAAYEHKGDFGKALEVFRAYAAVYGSTPELEKEIAFLESR